MELKKYGWYHYGDSPRSIMNFLTGQQLVATREDWLGDTKSYVGEYRDAEIQLPVRFNISPHRGRGNLVELDYAQFGDSISYGLWRRLDDFLTDALLSWPELLVPRCRFSLLATGGWWGGAWKPEWKRLFRGEKDIKPGMDGERALAEPCLSPLGRPEPKGWRYIDHPQPACEANLHLAYVEPWHVPYIAANSPLDGFQGDVPYLVRDDARAVFFPSRVGVRRDKDGDITGLEVYYTYADENVFFTFRSVPHRGLELWSCMDYGYRHFPPDRQFWPSGRDGLEDPHTMRNRKEGFSHFAFLSYRMWRELVCTTSDAWLHWPDPGVRIEHRPSGLGARVGAHGPDVVTGYTAGLPNYNIWLQYRGS